MLYYEGVSPQCGTFGGTVDQEIGRGPHEGMNVLTEETSEISLSPSLAVCGSLSLSVFVSLCLSQCLCYSLTPSFSPFFSLPPSLSLSLLFFFPAPCEAIIKRNSTPPKSSAGTLSQKCNFPSLLAQSITFCYSIPTI